MQQRGLQKEKTNHLRVVYGKDKPKRGSYRDKGRAWLSFIVPRPWNNQNRRFSDVEQDFHQGVYSQASDLYGIFAVTNRDKVTNRIDKQNNSNI